MQLFADLLARLSENESVVLIAIFVGTSLLALLIIFSFMPFFETRRRSKAIKHSTGVAPIAEFADDGINQELHIYYETFLASEKNSLRRRLIEAGYFGQNAVFYFTMIRIFGSFGLFIAAYFAIEYLTPSVTPLNVFLLASVVGALGLIGPSFVLDHLTRARRQQYQRTFPDFLDMLVVCADAGLAIEAAAQRVSRDYLTRDRAFGIHLGVMMLEVRAGKRLRDALASLSDRTGLEEAKTLATLFRQSEELGVSLTRALRTHSKEMRQLRLLRAEEKANVLPVKLLLPLGAFIFPVTLLIVLVPMMIRLMGALGNLSPSGVGL